MRDAVEVAADAWCAWCGEALPEPEERTWHQRFCCKACKDAHHNDLQKERRWAERERRSCRQCGAEFVAMPRNRLFCSARCSNAWHNGKKRMGRAAPGVAPCDPAGAGKTESAE
jgi:predicted nucleic acid-binding Zn ribbon protein